LSQGVFPEGFCQDMKSTCRLWSFMAMITRIVSFVESAMYPGDYLE
jgi:hypothetical protein